MAMTILLSGLASWGLAGENMIDLPTFVQEKLKAGEKRIVIPHGTYRSDPKSKAGVILFIQKAEDVEIVADGVTLICTRRTRALEFNDCRNVTLQGLTIDYDPLTFTQGKVVGAAEDASWIDITIDAGYPREAWSRIDVIDPATRFRKKGMPFLWGTKAELVKPDVVRVKLKDVGKAARVGDLATLSTGNDPGGVCHGVTLERCRGGMVFRDVTIHCAPGMGFVESGGAGGTRLERVKIVAGPKPSGATAERLLTTSWDGILHTTVSKGPIVEDCVIEHCGDDSWSVQSEDYIVLKCDGANAILAPRGYQCLLQAGDRLFSSLEDKGATIREIASVAEKTAGLDAEVTARLEKATPWTLWKISRGALAKVTLTQEPGWRAGTSLYSPERQGNGFIFRKNRVHSSGRILIKAGDGLIEENTLTTPHGLVICPEVPDESAVGIRKLSIRKNTIIESGYFCPAPWSSQAGAISITCSAAKRTFRPAGAFSEIVIEENTLRGISGANLVVTSARDVTIRKNRFEGAHATAPGHTGGEYGIDQKAVVWIESCDGVVLDDNVVAEQGTFGGKLLYTGRNVKGLVDGGNGITEVPPK
jgi:hypothetical protein